MQQGALQQQLLEQNPSRPLPIDETLVQRGARKVGLAFVVRHHIARRLKVGSARAVASMSEFYICVTW